MQHVQMPEPIFSAIDHVQLAMPPGEENRTRAFYGDLLGMVEILKPPGLAKRGGRWFESGRVQIHLGVEADFRPAKKGPRRYTVETTRRSSNGCAVLTLR